MKKCTYCKFWILPVFILLSLIANRLQAQKNSVPNEVRVDSLFSFLNASFSPGIAVAVVKDGQVVLEKGYGMANLEYNIPITPETVFDVGSLDKQFTGFLVALLTEEGKINPGDSISKYLPALSGFGHAITIEQLLHHTSGIRDWQGSLYLAGWRADDPITSEQIIDFAHNQRSLNFKPGTEHLYSNTGYNLLVEILEKITGKEYGVLSYEKIFEPLDMVQTSIVDDYNRLIPKRADAYQLQKDGTYKNVFQLRTGALYSTVRDFAKWMINFYSRKVGGQKVLELMKNEGTLNDGTAVEYASGITHGSYRGLPMFTSNGSWGGYNAFDVYLPTEELGIAVFSNNSGLNAQNAVIKIANIYLEDSFPSAPNSPTNQEVAEKIAEIPPAVLDNFAGAYQRSKHSSIHFERFGSVLVQRKHGSGASILTQISENEFITNKSDAIVFHKDSIGKASAINYNGEELKRVDTDSLQEHLKLTDYIGYYDSDELGGYFEIALNNDHLEVISRQWPDVALTAVWIDGFISNHPYLAIIEFERDQYGKVSGLIINGDDRTRNNYFHKRNNLGKKRG